MMRTEGTSMKYKESDTINSNSSHVFVHGYQRHGVYGMFTFHMSYASVLFRSMYVYFHENQTTTAYEHYKNNKTITIAITRATTTVAI